MREREFRLARTVIVGDEVLRAHAASAPEVSALAKRLARHAGRISSLFPEEFAATRNAAGDVARRLASLKDLLREQHLKRIAKAGRKLMKKLPGVARALAVPPRSAPAEKLVASARAMLKAVHPARKLFHDAGFARDFEKTCADAAAALARAARESDVARREGARVRRQLADETRDGRALIEVIDAVLQPRFARDQSFESAWRSATRVGRRIGRPPRARRRASRSGPPPEAGQAHHGTVS